MNIRNFFLLVICFLMCRSVFGQELHFTPFEPSQTLPSSETYHLLQDNKGYIWITTDGGICRYDGTQLTVFTVADGLPENVVFGIYEDRHGRIWFSTLSGYFFYFENGKFTCIGANEELKKICNPHTINAFFIGAKDTLYCATSSVAGVLKIPPQNNYKQIIPEKSPYEKSNRFLLQNKTNSRECLMGRGMEDVDKTDSSFTFYASGKKLKIPLKNVNLSAANIWNGKCDKNGNIYIPSGNMVTVIRKANGAVENYYFEQAITWITEDYEGDLWLGLRKKGGLLFKNADLKTKPVRFMDKYSIADFLLDREGSVWVTTLEKGVFQCFSKKVLDVYMPDDRVVDFQIFDDCLNVGLFSRKLLSYNKFAEKFSEEEVDVAATTFLNCFYISNKERYFGGSSDISWLNNQSSISKNLIFKGRHISSRKLLPLKGDSLLVVSSSTIFIVLHGQVVDEIPLPFRIGCVTILKNNTILVGSKNNNGIYILKNKTLIPYATQWIQLKTRINGLKEDEQGNLWIATNEKGLCCIDHHQMLHIFDETNGLVSNKVGAIAIDQNNSVWIGTNKGLSKLTFSGDFKNVDISNFDKSHGLPALEIDQFVIFNGDVWCGSKEHLFHFKCDEMKKNLIFPFTYFKSIEINGKSFAPFLAPKLSYNENNINIEFEGITFKNSGTRSFLYKMEGYDKEWKYSNTATVQYTNLEYGHYTFNVYALNNDKLKSYKPATFNFEIEKPFWCYWWFILMECLLVLLLVYFVAKKWSDAIKKKEAEKIAMNKKVAELHMTAIRAQMNPHFLFNAISSIQHYIFKNEPYESYRYLAKFSLLIRNVLDNSQEEYISIVKELFTLRLYVELEQIRFESPFEFIIEVDEQLNKDETYIPTMLLQSYLENAIWHGLSPQKENGKLSIVVKKMAADVQILITDNGIGRAVSFKMKEGTMHVSKGMSLSSQRLEALEIKNEKKYAVQVVDLFDEKSIPSGTQVVITIPLIEF